MYFPYTITPPLFWAGFEAGKMAVLDGYNTRLLSRTIPFDNDKAILFVREKGEDSLTTGRKASDDGTVDRDDFSTGMRGEDARAFYESVIESVHKPARATTKERVVRKKKEPPEKPKTISRQKIKSLDELFKFVQEGELEETISAISTGNYDINVKDGYDWSLLMCASCAGHAEIVGYLLDKGAEWRGVTDRRGYDAPALAEKSGHIDLACQIRTFKKLKNESDDKSETPNQDMDYIYCDVCDIETSRYLDHSVSTLHQFSCQHKSDLLPYSLPRSNKGFQMMVRNGWDPEDGLGTNGQGRQHPVKTVLKRDRYGLGAQSSRRPRVTHFRSGDINAVKSRRWRYTETKCRTKREREKLLQKQRGWEINMRQYMNSDY